MSFSQNILLLLFFLVGFSQNILLLLFFLVGFSAGRSSPSHHHIDYDATIMRRLLVLMPPAVRPSFIGQWTWDL